MLAFLIACGGQAPPLPAHLAPPPDSPNCVHSLAPAAHRAAIEPLRFSGEPQRAWQRLDEVVMAQARVEKVAETADYRQYVFTTAVLGFKDDVQFELGDGVVHFRSASRVGKSDLGVNRRRMEAIRAAFSQE